MEKFLGAYGWIDYEAVSDDEEYNDYKKRMKFTKGKGIQYGEKDKQKMN